MTKQQYMNWKINNPVNILYHYYITHEKRKHSPLDSQSLIMQLQMKGWNIQKIMNDIMEKYDAEFEIVTLLDRHGNFIKYL
jgi:hypothetical protein